jgi:betaine-aldehyde dehydrogenase
MFIDSEWVKSSNGKELPIYGPATGRVIEKVPEATSDDVGKAVDAARDAFDSGPWGKWPPSERANVLLKIATMLEERLDEFAKLETRNTGKSIKQSRTYDLPYTVDNIRFLAGAARMLDGVAMSEYVAEGTSAIRREPIGVVAAITPWNYPIMMTVWRAFPALATGNTVVLKPATYTPLTTLALADLAAKAGVPKGVFNVITGPGTSVGETLASHSGVDAIGFTGSTEVGRRLSGIAAGTVKKVSLELGGKAPFIVLDDAEIEAATEGAVVSGLVNTGQDCSNSTRYYVHGSVMPKFRTRLLEKLKKVVIADPEDPRTDIGPLISKVHRNNVQGYIDSGVAEGGKLLYGGGKWPSIAGHEEGYFIEPTVIQTDNNDAKIVKEEIFGPVFTLLEIGDLNEAIKKSNDVIYGLGASVWTKDVTRAMRAVKELHFGTVWVNEHVPIPSEMPWPAWKQSGHGASMSKYSLEEFTYIKHVYFDLTGKVRKSWYYQVYGQQP